MTGDTGGVRLNGCGLTVMLVFLVVMVMMVLRADRGGSVQRLVSFAWRGRELSQGVAKWTMVKRR